VARSSSTMKKLPLDKRVEAAQHTCARHNKR
jgi:hypothetical protein